MKETKSIDYELEDVQAADHYISPLFQCLGCIDVEVSERSRLPL